MCTSVSRGRPLCHGPPQTLKMKNCKKNQAVLAKAKLAFREYSGFALDFDFPVKNHSWLRPLIGRNLSVFWTGLSG